MESLKKYLTPTVAFGMLCVMIWLSIVSVSLAWLFNSKEINPDLSFSAGGPEDYQLYKITCQNDTKAHVVEETNMVGTSGFTVDDLQFGKITNLGMLENSNYVYYAVKVPKENGTKATFGISYGDTDGDGSHFKVYLPEKDGSGNIITDGEGNIQTSQLTDAATLASLSKIETDNSATFVNCKIALSATAPDALADVDALNALFTGNSKSLATDNGGNPVTETITFTGEADDFYYAYIKLEPNVSIYSGFIEYLWNNMPFFLAYEVRVTFEVEK